MVGSTHCGRPCNIMNRIVVLSQLTFLMTKSVVKRWAKLMKRKMYMYLFKSVLLHRKYSSDLGVASYSELGWLKRAIVPSNAG